MRGLFEALGCGISRSLLPCSRPLCKSLLLLEPASALHHNKLQIAEVKVHAAHTNTDRHTGRHARAHTHGVGLERGDAKKKKTSRVC